MKDERVEQADEEPFGALAEPFKTVRMDTQFKDKMLSFEISEVQPTPSQQ